MPWSMQMMLPLVYCQECGADWPPHAGGLDHVRFEEHDKEDAIDICEEYKNTYIALDNESKKSDISPLVAAPMMMNKVLCSPTISSLLQEYRSSCEMYSTQMNSGVLASLRYSLPAMRVSGPFFDSDMLALSDILIRHVNGPLAYIRRLDFSRASKEGKLNGIPGFRSHGAFCLAKVLTISKHIEEVRLQRHRIGHFGSSAIFLAVSQNLALRSLTLRRCMIGEKGALAFAEIIGPSMECGLQYVDLSANRIGLRGCLAIEQALEKRKDDKFQCLEVDLEGNLILQEVMNGVTHGLGILLAFIGSTVLLNHVQDKSLIHRLSCTVYSGSLVLLYTSSTLFHSFFTMLHTKYIFGVLDKCAIYIVIAGSYTPFLQISLGHVTLWSVWLLLFIWFCCIAGIYVEACFPDWKYKKTFSLLMYLGMGWACMVCVPEMLAVLPPRAIHLLVMGGVSYTSGVPFFVRNNNLDHSIWHLFVLGGSMIHWFCIYLYVVDQDIATCDSSGYCEIVS